MASPSHSRQATQIAMSSTSNTSPSSSSSHHYAFDAVKLLDDCIDKLQLTLDRDIHCHHIALYDMKQSLICTERILHHHLLHVLQVETQGLQQQQEEGEEYLLDIPTINTQTLSMTVDTLDRIMQEKKRINERKQQAMRNTTDGRNPQESPPNKRQDKYCYYPSRQIGRDGHGRGCPGFHRA